MVLSINRDKVGVVGRWGPEQAVHDRDKEKLQPSLAVKAQAAVFGCGEEGAGRV